MGTRATLALPSGELAVSLPLLMAVLAAGTSGLRGQWEGASVAGEARLLAAYAAVVLGASLLLYDHVWED